MLTGESVPVRRVPGDEVIGGTRHVTLIAAGIFLLALVPVGRGVSMSFQ